MNPAMARIVAVDDFPEALELIREVLEPLDHEVITFVDGEQALEYLSAQEVELLILDVRMPGMDGRQILEKLQKIVAERFPTLILLCGNLEEGTLLSQDLAIPARAVLSKPFTISALMHTVQTALEGSSPGMA